MCETAASMYPCSAQSGSKCGDLLGMRMYSTSSGTMESSQRVSTWRRIRSAFMGSSFRPEGVLRRGPRMRSLSAIAGARPADSRACRRPWRGRRRLHRPRARTGRAPHAPRSSSSPRTPSGTPRRPPITQRERWQRSHLPASKLGFGNTFGHGRADPPIESRAFCRSESPCRPPHYSLTKPEETHGAAPPPAPPLAGGGSPTPRVRRQGSKVSGFHRGVAHGFCGRHSDID